MNNLRELPNVRILIPFIIGIGIQRYLNWDTWLVSLLILCGLLLISFIVNGYKYRALSQIGIIAILLTLGYTRADLKENYIPQNHFQTGQQILIGVIQENLVKKNKYRTTLKIEYQQVDGNYIKSDGNLLCYFDIDSLSEALIPGDRILLNSNILITATNNNPLAFDFKTYLHNRGIDHQCFLRADNWILLNSNNLNLFHRLAYDLRDRLLKVIRKHIVKPDEQAIAAALILGYRNQLTEDIYKAYTDTGSVHVLAVSGLHLGILTTLLLFLLNLYKSENPIIKAAKAILVIAVIWAFALVTGAAPAVIRAATMFTIFTAGSSFRRQTNTYNILAGSAIVLLLYDPFLLYQASFQFSYMALTSILYFHPIIAAWWIPKNTLVRWIWNLAVVSIAAQVLVFPVTVYYFHKFPVYFILSGIVAVPSAAVIIFLALFLFLLDPIVPLIADCIGYLLAKYVEFFLWSIMEIRSLPMCSIEDILIRFTDMLLIYILLLSMMIWISFKRPRMIFVILASALLYIGSNIYFLHQNINQKELIVYDLNGAVAADLVIGQSLYPIVSGNPSKSSLAFANENLRLSKKIMRTIPEHHEEINTQEIIIKHDDYYSIGNSHLLVLTNETILPKVDYIDIDYLLIGRVSPKKLDYALKHIRAKNIILTNANKFWEIEQHKDILTDHPYHYVGTDGAYIQAL